VQAPPGVFFSNPMPALSGLFFVPLSAADSASTKDQSYTYKAMFYER